MNQFLQDFIKDIFYLENSILQKISPFFFINNSSQMKRSEQLPKGETYPSEELLRKTWNMYVKNYDYKIRIGSLY